MDYGDALLFPPAEASPEINDFNALVKQSAESLLPLLGDQIRLRLFSRYGPFPVALRVSEIESILSRLFIHVKEEVGAGCTIFIGTADFKAPGYEYSNLQPEVSTQAVLTFRYPRARSENEQSAVASQTSADRKTISLRTVLQELKGLIEERMGFLSLDEFCSDTVIQICFPIANQSGTASGPHMPFESRVVETTMEAGPNK